MIQSSDTKNNDVFIQTLPNGNLEIVISRLQTPRFGLSSNVENPGGMIDDQICSIPKSKVPELILFLQGL